MSGAPGAVVVVGGSVIEPATVVVEPADVVGTPAADPGDVVVVAAGAVVPVEGEEVDGGDVVVLVAAVVGAAEVVVVSSGGSSTRRTAQPPSRCMAPHACCWNATTRSARRPSPERGADVSRSLAEPPVRGFPIASVSVVCARSNPHPERPLGVHVRRHRDAEQRRERSDRDDRLREHAWADPLPRQPADFSLMRSSTACGMVVSKSRSLAQVGVIVMTTISS